MRRAIKALLTGLLATFGGQNRQGGKSRLIVLMYHRVLPKDSEQLGFVQPGMYVTAETFAQQMKLLKQKFRVVRLADWVRALKSGSPLPGLSVAITFDDGWRDNYQYAYPVLQAQGLPATIFLVSGYIGGQYGFWPEYLVRILRNYAPIDGDARVPQIDRWLEESGFGTDTGKMNQEDLDTVIEYCKKRYTDTQMNEILGGFDQEVETGDQEEGRELLNWQEIYEMQDGGLVDFGSHTRQHARLNENIQDQEMQNEVALSRADLEEKLNREVELFCYPNGDYTEQAAMEVSENYIAAVTTRRGWNDATSDLRLMKRIGVHDDITNTDKKFLARLSGWV